MRKHIGQPLMEIARSKNDFRQLKLPRNFCIGETFSKFTYLLSYQLIQY